MEGLFKVQDVNSIIKLFAFSIQQRFQQIDGVQKNNNESCNQYLSSESFQDSDHLIRKYRNYMASDQKQIKYLQKLVTRILQILDFFKQRSKNQQILAVALKRIQEKLNKITKANPIDVQWLYSYILDLARNGFSARKTIFRDRRYSIRKIDMSQHKVTEQNAQVKKQNEQSDQIKFIPLLAQNVVKQRRPMSLSAKRAPRTSIPKQPPIQVQFSMLYSMLQIDFSHIQKIIEAKDKTKLEKDTIKQNHSISNAISSYQRSFNIHLKRKEKQKGDNTLKQVNNRSSIRPVINNWISRKRKMVQCRKRNIDCQNMSFS